MSKPLVNQTAAPASVVLQVLLVPLLWGSAFALSKLGVENAGPLIAATARFGLAAIFMGGILLLRRGQPAVPLRLFPKLALLGLLGVGIYNWAFFLGLNWAPSSDGALIIPILGPIWTTLLAAAFLGEELTKRKVVGLVLALLGAVVFFWSVLTQLTGGGLRLWGDLLFAVGTISFSGYTLLGKKVIAELGPLTTTAWAFIFGGAMIVLSGLPQVLHGGFSGLGGAFWANMIYLAAFPSALAYTVFYRGVGIIGASRTAAFMYLVPVSAVTLGWWLLHEVPGPQQFVGGIIMLLGVVQVNRG